MNLTDTEINTPFILDEQYPPTTTTGKQTRLDGSQLPSVLDSHQLGKCPSGYPRII